MIPRAVHLEMETEGVRSPAQGGECVEVVAREYRAPALSDSERAGAAGAAVAGTRGQACRPAPEGRPTTDEEWPEGTGLPGVAIRVREGDARPPLTLSRRQAPNGPVTP